MLAGRLSSRGVAQLPVETLIYEDRDPIALSRFDGDGLWVAAHQLEAATGWQLRAEGFCRHDTCIAIPAGRDSDLMSPAREKVNVALLAQLRGQPLVHDDEAGVWVVGRPVGASAPALGDLAPDFTLPDLYGVEHRLRDYRGRKVLLLAWASW